MATTLTAVRKMAAQVRGAARRKGCTVEAFRVVDRRGRVFSVDAAGRIDEVVHVDVKSLSVADLCPGQPTARPVPTNLATWRALRAAGWTVRDGAVYDEDGMWVEKYDEASLAQFFGTARRR